MPPRHHGMAYQSAAQTFGHGNQFTKMKSSIMFNVKLQTSNIFKHLNGGLSQLYLYSWCIMIIMNYNMNSHQKSWHPIISPGYVWYSGHGARSETEGSQPGCSWAKMGTCPSVIGPFFLYFFGKGNDGENMGNSMKPWFLVFNIREKGLWITVILDGKRWDNHDLIPSASPVLLAFGTCFVAPLKPFEYN